MLVATTKVLNQKAEHIEVEAKIVGRFDFSDRENFTHLIIKHGEKSFRFPIHSVPLGDKQHRVALMGEKSLDEIQELIPGLIPIQVNNDQYLPPKNGGHSHVFLF